MGLFVLLLLTFLFGLVGLVTDAGRGPPIPATPAGQATQTTPVEAADAPLRVPQPQPDERDELLRDIDVLSAAIIEGDDSAVVGGLTMLRERAGFRLEQWRSDLARARSAGVDVPASDAYAESGVAKRGAGWIALDQGDRETARLHFADALWVDAADADAWLGYGLSTASPREAIGTVAVALLLYPDVATARERRDTYSVLAARGDAGRQAELDNVFVAAAPSVERQRRRLPRELVRLSEPFAWNAP